MQKKEVLSEEPEVFNVLLNTMNKEDWLKLAHRQDQKVNNIIKYLGSGEEKSLTKAERELHEEYSVIDGRLYRRSNDKLLWVVPNRARSQIVRICHDNVGQNINCSERRSIAS